MKKFERVVPIVTPTSSYYSLTQFLLFSFQEEDRSLVEDILLKREKGFKDELHKLEQDLLTIQKASRMELELSGETHEKELKRERDLCKSKLSWAEVEKEKLEKKLRMEFGERVEVLEGIHRDFEKRVEVGDQKLKILEEAVVKRDKDLEDEIVRREELKRERDFFENKLSLLEKEKCQLLERLRKELEGRIEELEGENRELRKKIELSKETLGMEFAMVEERFAKMKGFFGSGNAETDRGSRNDYHGRVVSITDSHHKASNWQSFLTKSQASPGDPSFRTSQIESRGSEGTTLGVQLEVKTENSLLEYKAEDGGFSENNINCKRKRRIYETEGVKDFTAVNRKTERLLESGCKKISLPMNFSRKVDPAPHGVSKANSLSKFSSTCIKQCKVENGRHENSELHFTKSFSGVVDETNRCSRGDPHEAPPANKAVATSRSDKVIRWKHPVDMLSAFGNDLELCMAAVCALYRQTMSARISRNRGGFSSFDIVSGSDVAKYLINNDPALKLSRTLSEVRQNCPSILRSCQTLANQYGHQLFEIYHNKSDPFFCSKSF